MATYDSGADDWFASTVAGGAFGFSDRLNLLYASVPQFGKSFALGGNSGIIQGFLYFDSSVPDSLTWTNVTQDATGNDVPSNIGGAMIHVPMGRSGILLVIGGAESSREGNQYANGWHGTMCGWMRFLFTISIRTGSIRLPLPETYHRSQVQISAIAFPDHPTLLLFQVTIYGG